MISYKVTVLYNIILDRATNCTINNMTTLTLAKGSVQSYHQKFAEINSVRDKNKASRAKLFCIENKHIRGFL